MRRRNYGNLKHAIVQSVLEEFYPFVDVNTQVLKVVKIILLFQAIFVHDC